MTEHAVVAADTAFACTDTLFGWAPVQHPSRNTIIRLGYREVSAGPKHRGGWVAFVPHSARTAKEDETVVDILAPIRAECEKAMRLAPSPGRRP